MSIGVESSIWIEICVRKVKMIDDWKSMKIRMIQCCQRSNIHFCISWGLCVVGEKCLTFPCGCHRIATLCRLLLNLTKTNEQINWLFFLMWCEYIILSESNSGKVLDSVRSSSLGRILTTIWTQNFSTKYEIVQSNRTICAAIGFHAGNHRKSGCKKTLWWFTEQL